LGPASCFEGSGEKKKSFKKRGDEARSKFLELEKKPETTSETEKGGGTPTFSSIMYQKKGEKKKKGKRLGTCLVGKPHTKKEVLAGGGKTRGGENLKI